MSFWFEFASTYSYPAAMRVEALAAERGIAVSWRAFLLGPIFSAQGWNDSPFNIYPVKGRYMWRDLERICAAHEIPFRRPSQFPRNGLLAARVACRFSEAPWVPAFVRAVYRANFAEDRDISAPDTIARCLADAGQDPAGLLEQAQSAESKALLRAQSERGDPARDLRRALVPRRLRAVLGTRSARGCAGLGRGARGLTKCHDECVLDLSDRAPRRPRRARGADGSGDLRAAEAVPRRAPDRVEPDDHGAGHPARRGRDVFHRRGGRRARRLRRMEPPRHAVRRRSIARSRAPRCSTRRAMRRACARCTRIPVTRAKAWGG